MARNRKVMLFPPKKVDLCFVEKFHNDISRCAKQSPHLKLLLERDARCHS